VTSGEDTLSYFNIPIAYYGGGLNLSTVTYNGYIYEDSLAKELLVNLLENYLDLASSSSSSSMMSYMKTIMLKAVTVVIGFKPFRFTLVKNNSTLFNLTYNKAPNVSTLITNAKGE
jgi:hypothetical protein